MFVICSENTHFSAGIEDGAMFEGIGECDVVFEGEMPFVVFHPAVFVLCLLLIG